MSKIALVTLDYPPQRGGVARYLGDVVTAAEQAIDVFVDASHDLSGPGHVEQVRLMAPRWPNWRPMVCFIRGLRKRGYDWVFVSHVLPVGTAAWLARAFGGPNYVVLLHGLDVRLVQKSIWKRWIARWILHGAGSVLVNSEFTKQETLKLDPCLRPVVITPGVTSLLFPSRPTARQRFGLSEQDAVILSVSRLVSRKGIDRLLEALSLLPQNARLVVIGDGEDRERLQRLAQTVVARVTFVLHASDEERNAWYAAADVFALPVRDEGEDVEGFGIVYLEAALAGLPVVAGRSGGAAEAVVDGVTGQLVDPQDVNALAAVLRQLVDDPTLRQRLGAAGRERALRDFSWQARWQRIKQLLNV